MPTVGPIKLHPSIGCCGIDCALCPRFHTEGASRCPGCGGPGFAELHPSCGFLTCCASRHGHEVCALCNEYPCARFKGERRGLDSFVTHARVFTNQEMIRSQGLPVFLEQQAQRLELLKRLLSGFNDGRSKSLFCTACALLPLEALSEAVDALEAESGDTDVKRRAAAARGGRLEMKAARAGISLKLLRGR